MSITRVLAGPVLGTAAAGLVLYGAGSSLAIRTHQVTDTLHSSSRNLRRLAEVDDTQDLLKTLDVAPENEVLASKLDQSKQNIENALPSAYQRPSEQSLTEQIKARWNEKLIALTNVISETDLDKIVSSISNAGSFVYSKVSGQTITTPDINPTGPASTFASNLRALAPTAPQAATLRDPVVPLPDARLYAPNTHYVGQGASLR
ncbi:uncharacterized protein FA14DRAFT_171411 [Meira miltonrushii]|uniref:Uncharacterized protein n=1 Tax=Meira miltonrushii TaxID=1280837 RepID=A0A316VGM1_9BASI|nr:uncharacterized protein FA14DRAFT_171411 [Meira miltonrushii]PWN34645.1 hypothetical protein FA14DRAFT_171411 [Meira miltonrushii]